MTMTLPLLLLMATAALKKLGREERADRVVRRKREVERRP